MIVTYIGWDIYDLLKNVTYDLTIMEHIGCDIDLSAAFDNVERGMLLHLKLDDDWAQIIRMGSWQRLTNDQDFQGQIHDKGHSNIFPIDSVCNLGAAFDNSNCTPPDGASIYENFPFRALLRLTWWLYFILRTWHRMWQMPWHCMWHGIWKRLWHRMWHRLSQMMWHRIWRDDLTYSVT